MDQFQTGGWITFSPAPSDLVSFLRDNLPAGEESEYIVEKNVGADALIAARRCIREIQGLGTRGQVPLDLNPDVVKAFRWVVKHGMTRPVMDWFRDGKGHREVSRCINTDTPLPGAKRQRMIREREEQLSLDA